MHFMLYLFVVRGGGGASKSNGNKSVGATVATGWVDGCMNGDPCRPHCAYDTWALLELPAHYVNATPKDGMGILRGRRGNAIVSTVFVLHFTDIVVPSIKGLFYAYISRRNRIRNRIESKTRTRTRYSSASCSSYCSLRKQLLPVRVCVLVRCRHFRFSVLYKGFVYVSI